MYMQIQSWYCIMKGCADSALSGTICFKDIRAEIF